MSGRPGRRVLAILLAGAVLVAVPRQATAKEPPLHQQILERLRSDADVVLPWLPAVQDIATLYNREAPIPPQCYTDTGGLHNPCYVCHQNAIRGRENTMNDRDLQKAYSFTDEGLRNHWSNLFEDRSKRVARISDAEILAYVNQDNYTELAQRLRAAGFSGWIPDLANLADGPAAFDAEGVALDGSWWVAFSYKPLPSTFWPTQGSTDDVMIRLPPAFYTSAGGSPSRDVYKANLALLEANIKGYGRVGSLPISETIAGADLNGDGQLGTVREVRSGRARYVGAAANVDLIPAVYPEGTEFLHTVRYVGVRPDGSIYTPRRMKEVRYMQRRTKSRHFQLQHYYEEEDIAKEYGALPTYYNFGHQGLGNDYGWNLTGFIENRQGRLRWNTYEENVFCMGCHSSVGSTIDKTFSFPRKPDGAAGWGYMNVRNMPDAPNAGETLGEVATYFDRVGGGTEFRSNPELERRFFHGNGTVNTVALAMTRNLEDMIAPSKARALTLNKAYRAIVDDQDFIYGRDATTSPPERVLPVVDNETSPTLPAERQQDWNIVLDWTAAAAGSCNYRGNVDFTPLSEPHVVILRGLGSADVDRVCAEGAVKLAGDLEVHLKAPFQPRPGDRFEIVRGGSLSGAFSTVTLPSLPAGFLKLVRDETTISLLATGAQQSR